MLTELMYPSPVIYEFGCATGTPLLIASIYIPLCPIVPTNGLLRPNPTQLMVKHTE
jgi:hypothetical protein